MAILTSQITGAFLSPLLTGVSRRLVRVVPRTVDGMLRTVGGDVILGYALNEWLTPGDDGSLSITLPNLPQGDILPADAQYTLEIRASGPTGHRLISADFTLAGNTTWSTVLANAVASVDPSESLIADMNAIVTEVRAASQKKVLAPWFAALANRADARAKLLVIGNSIWEATGATSWLSRSQALVQDALRARYPVAGVANPGAGYIPARLQFGPSLPWTYTGTTVDASDFGLGRKVKWLDSAGGGAEAVIGPYDCDVIRLWYGRAALGGPAYVYIDDVQVADLSGNGTDPQRWVSGALTPGPHTLKVKAYGGFSFPLEAVEFFNGDWGKGIGVYDGAHFGYATTDFLNATADAGHWKAVAELQPQLVMIDLNANDWTAPRSADEYLANIDAMIAETNAAVTVPHSIMLVSGYQPWAPTPDNDKWEAMKAGLRARSGSGNVGFLDLDAGWPDLVADGSNSLGLMWEATNPIHPSDAGHQRMADMLVAAISEWPGGAGSAASIDTSLLESQIAGKMPYNIRTWNGTSWSARPTVPQYVPVIAYSTWDVTCTSGPADDQDGDIWVPHPDAAV